MAADLLHDRRLRPPRRPGAGVPAATAAGPLRCYGEGSHPTRSEDWSRGFGGHEGRASLFDVVDGFAIFGGPWRKAAGGAVLAALLLLTLPGHPRPRVRGSLPYTPAHDSLIAGAGAERPVEARLTGFAFAPWAPGTPEREPSERELADLDALARIDAEARARAAGPSTRGARAIAALAQGRLAAAVADLEAAIAADPDDPRYHSDLAATHLESARRGGGVRSLISALDAAERAVDLDGRSPEAAYNRALAIERLHLDAPAMAAWERVIELQPGSGWAGEARAHLSAIAEREPAEERWARDRGRLVEAIDEGRLREARALVDRHRQPVREWIERELLTAWGAGVEEGDQAAARRELARARTAATVLAELGGDGMPADAVAAIDRSSGSTRRELARGHRLYGVGWKLHEEAQYGRAGEILRRALGSLDAGGSRFAAWPRLHLATETYFEPDLAAALADLLKQERTVDADRHPVLSGQIHWMLALVRGRYGPLAAALPDCETALERFARARDLESRTSMESMLGRAYGETGDLERAWEHHGRALADMNRLRRLQSRENVLFNAISTLRTEGSLLTAMAFSDQALDIARREGRPVGLTVTLRQRGELLADLGRTEAATRELDAAWETSGEIPEQGHRGLIQGELLIARGRTICSTRPEEAIDAFTRADSILVDTEHRHRRVEALRERARCLTSRSRISRAGADLRSAILEMERLRGRIGEPELRRFFLDQSRALMEEWVANRVAAGRGREALATVERLRAPLLLDALGSADVPADPPALAAALPEGVAVLETMVLDDGVAAWVLREGEVSFAAIPVPRAELERRVRGFEASLGGGAEDELSGLLLRPLMPWLEGVRRLVVVPDGPLHAVSFAALRDPMTGRPLVRDMEVARAPSARVYLALAMRAGTPGATSARSATALVVGGVPFARELFPELSPLPGSGPEADLVASFYPRPTRLLGEAATPERVLAEIPHHEVVFVASHAATVPGSPELSSLLLAPSPSDPRRGLLPAGDIDLRAPIATRLVVLAACRTARGEVSPSEGSRDLARPFVAAGVPAVVATLWDLDEEVSLAFSRRFHAAHAAGADPLTAFHEAQLALANDPDPRLRSPRSWAGLVFIGASEPPPSP